jgi:phenylalanyl-tRNA synthetase beta chain
VGDATTDLLLEVAYFDPRRTRASRKRAGVSTDASYRFERGVDRAATLELLADVAALVVAVAGGTVDAVLDVGAAPGALPPVRLRAARVARVLGHAVPDAEIERVLASVGFAPAREDGAADGTAWTVAVPAWRHDVALEVDLIEEVARLVGFDALPTELRPFRPGTVPDHPLVSATRRVREALVADGLLEARPLPFVRGDDATHPRVANPLAEDEPHLRGSALDTLARRAEYNLSRMQGDVRLFEVGSVFGAPGAPGALPEERLVAAALVMGQRRPPHFTEPKPPAFDAWDAKALGERVARAAYPAATVALAPRAGDAGRDGDAAPDAGLLWDVVVDGRPAGVVRRLALDAPVWASPAFGVEVALGVVESGHVAAPGANVWEEAVAAQAGVPAAHVRYRPLATTPAAEFDLALVVPDAVAAGAVEGVLRRFGGDTLEQVALVSEFRGGDVPAGARSLAWRLTLRDPSRTLRQKEVDGRRQKLVQALERELGVRVRAG